MSSVTAKANKQMAYVARHSCGRIVSAMIDDPQHRRAVARETAAWIRRGDRVERMGFERAKALAWCVCWRPA